MRKLWCSMVAAALAAGLGVTFLVARDGGTVSVRPVSSTSSPGSFPVGAELIAAAVAHHFERAESLLAGDVELKGYTPTKGYFELHGAAEVMALLREWYGVADQSLEAVETGRLPGRERVGYRVRWSDPGQGTFVFEQQAYYDVAEGRITALQLVCSGDRPV